MNAALVNAIADRLRASWAPLEPIREFVIEDATAAAEAVADFVAALPHGYTAPDVLAAIRGESIEPVPTVAAVHSVTWEHDGDRIWGRIHCDADGTAACRSSCAEGCESWGDVSDDGTTHETSDGIVHAMRSHSYCNVVEQIANGDSLETYYDGPGVAVHDGPVLVSWDGDDYLWHYIETTGAGQAPASPDDDAATISAASAAAPVPDPYFLLRDHVASVAAVLRAEATGDERDGVWEEGYSDALADLVEALGVPR